MIGAITAGLFGAGVAASTTSYDSIATYTPTSGTSVTFNSIPSTYKHLQVRMSIIESGTASDVYLMLDSNKGLKGHYLEGRNVSATAGGITSNALYGLLIDNYVGTTASVPFVSLIDVLDYSNTNKYKTTRVMSGYEQNTTGSAIDFISGLYDTTSAISSLTITLFGGTATFASGSHIALYGIKG